MKALVLKNYHVLEYMDVPDPDYGPSEVLIKIKACGICGSDIHGMDGSTGRRIPPIIMGHEASGVITKVGADVKRWKPDDRVTFDSTIYPLDDWFTHRGEYNLSDNRRVLGVSCDEYKLNGAFAEYLAVPQHILHKIPEAVSFNQAAMTEPAAVAMHAVNLANISQSDTALVVGAGLIGSLVVQILKIRGCGKIIAVDTAKNRLKLAAKFGADVILEADRCNVVKEILTYTNNRGADTVFEAVGIGSTVRTAIECTRKGGSVTLIGNATPVIEIALQSIVTRQIKIQGSCAICGEYPEVLKLMEEGLLNVNDMISATVALSQGPEWFTRLYNKDPALMKVILNP